MPTLESNLRVRAEVPPGEVPFVLTSTNLSRVYFPGRGLLYSLLIHEIVFFGMLFLPRSRNLVDWARPLERPAKINRSEPVKIIYLPILGGGSQGLGLPGGSLKAGHKRPPAAAAPGTKGLSYPGPQPILSNPPDPTNLIQTVLQPALENPPTLKPLLPLPNLVQIADAGPVPHLELPAPVMKPPDAVKPAEPQPAAPSVIQPDVKATEPVLPPIKLAPPTPMDVPKLVLPASVPQDDHAPETRPPEPPPRIEPPRPVKETAAPKDVKNTLPPEPSPKPVERPETEPPPKTIEAQKEPPRLELSPLPSRGPDLHNLLALTPMPAPREQPFEVPPGEARGRFVISPDPNPSATEKEPGLKVETPSSAVGIGSQAAASGNAAGVAAGGPGASAGAAKDKDSSGGGTGAGTARGSGVGSAPGPGIGSGTGAGAGSGTGISPGTGAGSGPGKGAFSGITIFGGEPETGTAANSASLPRTPRPLQTSYGLTVISTEASGGGLPFFGVFSHSQIYSVYLDMRRTETDPAPSWPLEYAVLQGTAAPANAAESPSQSQQGLVLPFPTVKERPALPAELVRKYLRRMVIVYAIVNVEGKMEQMSVMGSPDVLLNEPVLNSLSKWIFRPAQFNGEPVAMKVLMGIPLWLPE